MTSKEKVINFIKDHGGCIVLHHLDGLNELFLSVLNKKYELTDSITEICHNLTHKPVSEDIINWDKVWDYINE
jgi:hypothetical protein